MLPMQHNRCNRCNTADAADATLPMLPMQHSSSLDVDRVETSLRLANPNRRPTAMLSFRRVLQLATLLQYQFRREYELRSDESQLPT